MKKNKKMSFRLRLVISTILMLIVVCVIFTVFSVINLNYTVVVPVQQVINKDADTKNSGTLMNAELGVGEKDIEISASSVINEFSHKIEEFIRVSILFMLVVIVIGGFVMYKVAGTIIKPVRRLKEEIATFDSNELSYRINDFEAGDELNQLADTFNNMLERLESTFLRESRFISDAAHEIKTPLAVIKANLDVLELDEHPSDEEYKNSYIVIKRQTQRLSSLMDELLNMATSNDYPLDQLVCCDEMVNEILLELEPRIQEKNIEIQTDMNPVSVRANQVMLKHAILNIIENAIKYNDESGKIMIKVFSEGNKGIIQVSDTGQGIPKEHQKNIFDPFYRVDKSRSRSMGGSGLGLAISKEIVMKHGGWIECKNNELKGSTFTIFLEIKQVGGE